MTYQLNKYIKEERKRQRLTQQHLANKLNCDSQLISSWETCRRRIPESRYKELSVALDIPLDKILELAKTEHIMNNIFHQKFSELYTPIDAMHFISYTLENFEIDSAHKVSLGAILRNYLLLQLIITMLEKKHTRIRKEMTSSGIIRGSLPILNLPLTANSLNQNTPLYMERL